MQDKVDTEVYIEYGFGFMILIIRLVGRIVLYGFGGLQWDDLCTLIAMLFWTAEVVLLVSMGNFGGSIGMTNEQVRLLDAATIENYRIGDKLNFASWCAYIVLIWSMKGIIIFNYHRLTLRLWQNKLNQWIGWAALACFLFCFVFQFTSCVPVEKSWQVIPVTGDKCLFRSINYIVFTCLSITIDLAILSVSLPILCQARVPPYKKIVLGGLLGSGVFIIAASIMRSVYSLLPPHQDIRLATQWSSREYLVTAFVCSVPGIRGLCSRRLWQQRRAGKAAPSDQHHIASWPGRRGMASGQTKMGGRAAGVGAPQPASLRTRLMRTSVASSAAHSALLNKPSSDEEPAHDSPLDDEERGTGLG